MAAYVQFYLNRGSVNGTQLVPASEIDRMESPVSTWAAHDGLKAGYGLSNYWTFNDGFVYHGHNGGVEGGLTEMAYLPEYNMGYFYSINSGNSDAFSKIGKAIRAYITLHLQRPAVPAPAALPSDAADYAGFYEPDSPRQEVTRFLDRLDGLSRLHFSDGKMVISSLDGTNTFIPVSGHLFRFTSKDDLPEPAASAALLTPNAEGRFIQAGGTMKRIPTPFAFFEILLTALVVLAMTSILLYAPVWIIGGLFKKRRRPAERPMRLWPLLAMLCLIAFVADFILCGSDIISRLGNVTVWSLAIFCSTLLFAATSLISAWAAWRARAEGARRSVRVYSMIVSAALVIATAYLAWWGIIGLRTWV